MDEAKLEDLSLDELRALRGRVDQAITSFEKRQRAAALAAAEEAVRAHGLKLSDLVNVRAAMGKGKGNTAAPKYANPDNAAETWSGRGRRPAWFLGALENGRTPEDLAI